MDASGLKKRKRNFTSADIDVIVSGVESNFDTLNSAFTNTVTNNTKKKIWKDITTRLNATGDITRNEDEVRKKWTDMKGCVKKAESARRLNARRTGGGPPPDDLTAKAQEERKMSLLEEILSVQRDIRDIQRQSLDLI